MDIGPRNEVVYVDPFSFHSELKNSKDTKFHIHEVKFIPSLKYPIYRKLINESNGIFLTLQKISQGANTVDLHNILIKISRQYRSVLKAYIDELDQLIKQSDSKSEIKESIALNELLNKVELIWNLCEILFIDQQPAGAFLTQLLEWIKWHFPQWHELAKEALKSGEMDDACQLLKLHPSYSTLPFRTIEELMRKMPLYRNCIGQQLSSFSFHWNQWQDECAHRSDIGEFVSFPELDTICKILCGEEEVILNLKGFSDTWYQYLVTYLLYNQPTIQSFELSEVAENIMQLIVPNENCKTVLDDILLTCMQFNIIESSLDTCWFSSHIADLLYHASVLCGQQNSMLMELRESLLLEYASWLMTDNSLWQVAVDYLNHCTANGLGQLELYLEHLCIQNAFKANKIIYIAMKNNLENIVTTISRIMSRKALQNEQLGTALAWTLRANDGSSAILLSDYLLQKFLENKDRNILNVLDSLDSSLFVCDQLVFLEKYREFHILLDKGEKMEAASLLLNLLSSKLAPKKLCFQLLQDAIPFLQEMNTILDSIQAIELTSIFHDLLDDYKSSDLHTEYEELIHLALLHCCANATLNSNTKKSEIMKIM